MAKMKAFEFWVGRFRMGIINAKNDIEAYEQAFDLCPGVDYRHIIVVPTTYELAMEAARY